MKNEIRVIYAEKQDDFNKIMNLYINPDINSTFGGYRKDRLAASEISFLIYLNNEPIGFILLVGEHQRKDSLGIDIALKKEYRGKGYGKIALEIFKEKYLTKIEDKIHVEVNKDNIAANKILDILDKEYIETIDNSNFYKISNKNK